MESDEPQIEDVDEKKEEGAKKNTTRKVQEVSHEVGSTCRTRERIELSGRVV